MTTKKPASCAALLESARVAISRERFALAETHLLNAMKARNFRGLCDAGVVEMLVNVGLRTTGDRLLERAKALLPGEIRLAVAYAERARRRDDFGEAIRRWQAVLRAAPGDRHAHIFLSIALRESDRFDEADAVIDAALALWPGASEFLIGAAFVARRRGDLHEALTRTRRAREAFPDVAHLYADEAQILLEMARFDEAEKIAAEGIRLFPADPTCAVRFASAAHHRRDWAEAYRRWSAAEKLAPERDDVKEGLKEARFQRDAQGTLPTESAADAPVVAARPHA